MYQLQLKRIYQPEADTDGTRILVDRLWPRGMSKVRADLVEWDKEIAPDKALLEAFHHSKEDWEQFQKDYLAELNANPAAAAFKQKIQDLLKTGPVTLLYGSKDEEHNNAVVLKAWLEQPNAA